MDTFEQTEKLWGAIVKTLEKLSLISAGTISLSITFLGYILGIGPTARSVLSSHVAFGIQISDVLFLSWIYTAISLFLGIIIRTPIAWHLFYSEVDILFSELERKSDPFGQKNIKIVGNFTEGEARFYRRISDFARHLAVILFVLGIFLLIYFAIVVSNRLIGS